MEITLHKPIVRQQQRTRSQGGSGGLLRVWCQRQQQRQALLNLDDRLLSDIGISRCEAQQEAAKPFWKT